LHIKFKNRNLFKGKIFPLCMEEELQELESEILEEEELKLLDSIRKGKDEDDEAQNI